jgi:hypothetical protein
VPRLTRWFIKSALLYLVVSLLVGAALAARDALGLPGAFDALLPVYFHLFMVGWVTQVIFGVAHWMFPRVTKEQPRGRESLIVMAYVGLNVGLLARAIAEPILALHPAPLWTGTLIASAVLQWLGALAFVVNTWPRVRDR